MQTSASSLDEVLVVGYGTVRKTAFTGSASVVDNEALEKRPVSNAMQALEGVAPGVTINSPNGQPGSTPSIRIRGFGSMNASNAPLIILNGAEYLGSMQNINPADIESLTVLKDGASAAIYGNRAANGVIMISTKKGKQGKPVLTISYSQSLSTRGIPEYDRLEPKEYYELMWEGLRNFYMDDEGLSVEEASRWASGLEAGKDGIIDELKYNIYDVPNNELVGVDGELNPNAKLNPLMAEDTDWFDQISRVGIRNTVNMTYSGANDFTDYYVSLGYTDDDGYILNTSFKRLTVNSNINSQVTPWFKTGAKLSAASVKTSGISDGSSSSFINPIRGSRYMGPIYTVHQHDLTTGEYILDGDGNRMYSLGDDRGAGADIGRNFIAENLWDKILNNNQRIRANVYGEIRFLKDFKFTANASLEYRNNYNSTSDNPIIGDGAPGGRLAKNFIKVFNATYNQLLNYDKEVGKHKIGILLGHETLIRDIDDFEGEKRGQISPGNTELINYTTITELSSEFDKYRGESYFGRINYSYDYKYSASFSYRRDGSSRFSRKSRWDDFFAVGASWYLSSEDFMKELTFIDKLKIKASYGELGVDAGIGWYAWQALYDLGNNNATEGGVTRATLGNEDLTWETSVSFDFGIEFELFERLRGSIEYYRKGSSNLLFDVPLPLSSGLKEYTANIGEMDNSGLEIFLSGDIIKASDLRWNMAINFTTLKNEIKKLPQEEIITGTKKYTVGVSRYEYWLRQWYGVNPDNGEGLWIADDTESSEVIVIDGISLTNNFNNAKYAYSGSAIPDAYGSVLNTWEYKGFSFSVLMTYALGGKIYDGAYRTLMNLNSPGDALHLDMLNRWQAPGDITEVPRLVMGAGSTYNVTDSRWLTDGSFLKLSNITLAYNLPKGMLNKLSISEAKIYISGENLKTWNHRKGMDNTQNYSGTISQKYQPSQIISFGINVTL